MKALLILILAVGLVSCKETHCPAFPTKLSAYYPYTNGELLKFKNSNSDTLTLKVIEDWASNSYSFDWNCKCACGTNAGFNTDSDNTYSLKIVGSISFYNENSISELSCNFYDAYVSNDGFSIQKEIENPYNEESSQFFGDTVFMEKQEYYRIGNVKIIKGKGIFEFWDKKQNCNWILIE